MGSEMCIRDRESCGLHKRIALNILSLSGTSPSKIIAGFMITTASISMWVSNTATAIMMLPIALSILALIDRGMEDADHSASNSTKEKTKNYQEI